MKNIIIGILLVAVIFLGYFMVVTLADKSQEPKGSVARVSEYFATTTTNNLADLAVLQSTRGTLGSVVVTLTGTDDYTLYNATTSNVNLRTGNVGTSSLLQIVIPASIAAGTYTFDTVFDTGILIDYGTNPASSTITYRP